MPRSRTLKVFVGCRIVTVQDLPVRCENPSQYSLHESVVFSFLLPGVASFPHHLWVKFRSLMTGDYRLPVNELIPLDGSVRDTHLT